MNQNELPISNATVISKLDELIAVVIDSKYKSKVGLDNTLWNTKDIADYIGMSYKYVHEQIVSIHTFPEAIRLPTKKTKNGHPRWYAAEVISWVAKYREGIGRR